MTSFHGMDSPKELVIVGQRCCLDWLYWDRGSKLTGCTETEKSNELFYREKMNKLIGIRREWSSTVSVLSTF